jgi:hypothetical protein
MNNGIVISYRFAKKSFLFLYRFYIRFENSFGR